MAARKNTGKGSTSLPQCVACLFRIGWGVKRVVRHTGYAKTTVHRFARANDFTSADIAAAKKRAEDELRRASSKPNGWTRAEMLAAWDAEWKGTRYLGELRHWAKHPEILGDARSPEMLRYYRDVEISRAKARQVARRCYAREKAHLAATWERHNRTIARALRTRIYVAVRRDRGTKSARSFDLVGCYIDRLRQWLSAQFTEGMSWGNYGAWEIDHIKPCASFDLRDPAQQRECFHYTNLQPLWRADNRAKWMRIQTFVTSPTRQNMPGTLPHPLREPTTTPPPAQGPRSRVSRL